MSFVTTATQEVMSLGKSSASLSADGSFQDGKEQTMIFPKEHELELSAIDEEIILVQKQEEGLQQMICISPDRAKKLATHLIQLADTMEKRGRK